MHLIETQYAYFIKDFFAPNITAGFTKGVLFGNMPQDLFTALGKEIPYAWMNQVHGPVIIDVEKQGKYEGDGLITHERDFALVVRTADCVPILLAGDDGNIAAVHMGWRSAQTGILDNLPKDLSGYKAVIGPCMRKCCFEVGEDFYQYKNFTPYIAKRADKRYFDPIGFARDNLAARGLNSRDLYDCGICTICSDENFFSFRKDKTQNRISSFILRSRQ
jgi:YfiH family protein